MKSPSLLLLHQRGLVVDGVPLYEWARLYHPTAPQMLRLLAQMALALQYLHAQGAVHRDVKGDNSLVRRSDSRLFLTDFGSSIYPGADPFTPPPVPPGTPAYRSPEAWLFSVQHSRAFTSPYSAGPADDLFALGVTACKLVTGAYPAMGEARKDEHGTWSMEPLVLPPTLHSARVAPPLRALILRMLSLHPEQRGTAAQLAQELERAAASLAAGQGSGAGMSPRGRMHSWRSWLVASTASLALAVWTQWMTPGEPVESPPTSQEKDAEEDPPEPGPVGLGGAAASASTEEGPKPPGPQAMAEDTPPEPQPGQTRPDAKGRCPRKRHVSLNGGCWVTSAHKGEACEEIRGHIYKGACYQPVIRPGRSPTSSPADQP